MDPTTPEPTAPTAAPDSERPAVDYRTASAVDVAEAIAHVHAHGAAAETTAPAADSTDYRTAPAEEYAEALGNLRMYGSTGTPHVRSYRTTN
ncbi:hypothetical protein [Streptomyces soliscabiei]|uniref:hypothetical protein n=1 Tax=Streptomyces soliscabiei TaxID=588897 RepID=UPI0029BA8496|nr:hypothetical protein [Streptomyces sp. NY05-11A]MDX2675803.1 hypothetical protein [Streptomyces sp. NY05-11A]